MKLALVFLMAFVAMSYQQRFQNKMPWMMPNYNPIGAYYDDYYYMNNPLARQDFMDDDESVIEIINPTPKVNADSDEDDDPPYSPNPYFWDRSLMYRSSPPSPYSPYLFLDYIMRGSSGSSYRNRFNPNPYFRSHPSVNEVDQQQEIQPRGRTRPAKPSKIEVPENRFLFGLFSNNEILFPANSTAVNRFFGKTRGVISTSTVNITTVISCVVSTEFVLGAVAPACRRRRRGMEHLLAFDDLAGSPLLSPTQVEKVETTLAPDSQTSYEQRNAKLNELLTSSKDELIIEDDEEEKGRKKRFFFGYVSTTTLTSYTFYSTSVIKTVRLLTAATTRALTCLPAGFSIC